jgi:hypothetical protein
MDFPSAANSLVICVSMIVDVGKEARRHTAEVAQDLRSHLEVKGRCIDMGRPLFGLQ